MELFGYIDPGTGSLFIQMVIGAGLAVVVVFRNFFIQTASKLRRLFGRRQDKNEEE